MTHLDGITPLPFQKSCKHWTRLSRRTKYSTSASRTHRVRCSCMISLTLHSHSRPPKAWIVAKANDYAREHGMAQFVVCAYTFCTSGAAILICNAQTKAPGISRNVTLSARSSRWLVATTWPLLRGTFWLAEKSVLMKRRNVVRSRGRMVCFPLLINLVHD